MSASAPGIDYDGLIDRYIRVWNGHGQDATELSSLFTDDVLYCDPVIVTRGQAELAAYIAKTMRQFPGMTFRAARVQGHHGQVRFTWSLGPPDTDPAVAGLDVALLHENRITAIHGFFD